jgi:hypothetical protein
MNLDDLFWQGFTPEEALGRRAFSKVRALPPPVGLALTFEKALLLEPLPLPSAHPPAPLQPVPSNSAHGNVPLHGNTLAQGLRSL